MLITDNRSFFLFLIVQLAELWPDGWMDNNGIKHAVQRAKDRKKKQIKANMVWVDHLCSSSLPYVRSFH